MNIAFAVLQNVFSSFRAFLSSTFCLFHNLVSGLRKKGTCEWAVELELGTIHCMPSYYCLLAGHTKKLGFQINWLLAVTQNIMYFNRLHFFHLRDQMRPRELLFQSEC